MLTPDARDSASPKEGGQGSEVFPQKEAPPKQGLSHQLGYGGLEPIPKMCLILSMVSCRCSEFILVGSGTLNGIPSLSK
jgi:hypothetical protein